MGEAPLFLAQRAHKHAKMNKKKVALRIDYTTFLIVN